MAKTLSETDDPLRVMTTLAEAVSSESRDAQQLLAIVRSEEKMDGFADRVLRESSLKDLLLLLIRASVELPKHYLISASIFELMRTQPLITADMHAPQSEENIEPECLPGNEEAGEAEDADIREAVDQLLSQEKPSAE